ncbi:hypothetical protein DES53_109287 [Roseimicrobium gellanilyticum]|uniref:Uncharacterized protein n=1 Tax=Roseimicrobium gellanilyticum TaxID=748857 RepID=A0A366HDG0_9BACT|nr:hypothetical protein DES53_109287 [Roseimicrobium gellanilyticum]
MRSLKRDTLRLGSAVQPGRNGFDASKSTSVDSASQPIETQPLPESWKREGYDGFLTARNQ